MPGWPEKVLLPSNDLVARMLFSLPGPLHFLLRVFFGFTDAQLAGATLIDPNFYPETDEGKRGIGDLRIWLPALGLVLAIEFQGRPSSPQRWLFYLYKLGASPVRVGMGHHPMPQVAFLAVTHYGWLPGSHYRHLLSLYDPVGGFGYPGGPLFGVLETTKIPAVSDGTPFWLLARFFRAKTADEFDWVAEQEGGAMAGIVLALKELSADEKARRLAEAHEKWLWDQREREEASRVEGEARGEARGRAKVARQLLREKFVVADVARLSGLPEAEVQRLEAEAL